MVLNSQFFNGSGYRPLTFLEQQAVSGLMEDSVGGVIAQRPFYVLVPSGEAVYANLAEADYNPPPSGSVGYVTSTQRAGQHRAGNTSILVHGHNAKYGINYLFPTTNGSLNEDFTTSGWRFENLEWYERSGVLISYPSNHPDELRSGATSQNPKELVRSDQGIKDSVAAFDKLSSDFSSASGELLDFTLGITNAFIHYYEDTYSQVYFPRGKRGPSGTRVNL